MKKIEARPKAKKDTGTKQKTKARAKTKIETKKTKIQTNIEHILSKEIAQLQLDKEELAHNAKWGYIMSAQGVLLKAAGNYAHLLMEQVLLEMEAESEEEDAKWEEENAKRKEEEAKRKEDSAD